MDKAVETRGRKPKQFSEIDRKLVIKLAAIHCTNEEICHIVGCDPATLQLYFSEDIKLAKSCGKASLRRKMWRAAQEGDRVMLIWLSKQLLGMKENNLDKGGDDYDDNPDDPMVPAITKEQARLLLEQRRKPNVP